MGDKTIPEMSASGASRCPVCGAKYPGGENCVDVFGELMAMEYADPQAFAVHPLTVACYMIQHGLYSDEAMQWILPRLRPLIDGKLDNIGLLEDARQMTRGARAWKITRQPGEPPSPTRSWSMTMAEIPRSPESVEEYSTAVKKWAMAILKDLGKDTA